MISARRLPAASILQVSAIAVRRAIDIDHRNTAMQFFLMKRTVSFYFIDYYYNPLTGAHWDKRYVFLVNTCAFFWPLHRINVH
jgi:predicted NAD/FAD-binding protein